MIAAAPVALAYFDSDLACVAQSRLWEERTLPCPGEGEGAHVAGLPTEVVDAMRRVLENPAEVTVETRGGLADGLSTWNEWHIGPLSGPDGALAGLAVSTLDITERKRAERKSALAETVHRLTVDALGIGVVQRDFDSGKTTIDETFRSLSGVGSGDLPGDFPAWAEVLGAADPDGFRRASRAAMDPGGDGQFQAELTPEIQCTTRRLQLRGRFSFPEADGSAQPSHFTGILIDDTEIFETNARRTRAQRLQTAGRIAGVIAHDFNNLLSVILANIELAELSVTDGQVSELLERARIAAEMGGNFNRKLLALSSETTVRPELVQVDNHILKTWSMLEHLLSEQVSLHFSPGGDGTCVSIDPAELDAAILNLVINARDAEPEGGKITISTEVVDLDAAAAQEFPEGRPGRFLRISVADTGIGMSPADLQKAREPFFTKKKRGFGTGLGLTSVSASIGRASGFLSIRSALEKGTEVSLYLPAEPCAEDQPSETENVPIGDGELVLVVEDDTLLRDATTRRLEALGYAVIEASNGEKALSLLADGEPVDLVFSDVVMPGEVSGYDVADEVQRSYPGVAIVMTSGHISGQIQSLAGDGPAPQLLKKPYSLTTLANAVKEALELSRNTG
ncbi:ATP-binding protein [Histidinibacterium aquaticum]|nr:ATP-binding protein [Histidinibacterium aquaticum]